MVMDPRLVGWLCASLVALGAISAWKTNHVGNVDAGMVGGMALSRPSIASRVNYPRSGEQYVAKFYSKGLMQKVYRNRVRSGLVTPRQGLQWYGATSYCGNIDRVMRVKFWNPVKETWSAEERVLIVDCAQPYHLQGQVSRRLGLEVSYEMAVKHQFKSEGKTVFKMVRWED